MNSTHTPTVPFNPSAWILAARPKTLLAGLCPVLLGSAMAIQAGGFRFMPAMLCLVFAVVMQVAANYANDYYDYEKGADNENRQGFTRTVASGMISPWTMKKATFIVLGFGALIGLNLYPYAGWSAVIVTLLCIAGALGYTAGPFPMTYYGLGDVLVLVFFGLVAVSFTFFAQVGHFSWPVVIVALGCGLMAANIRTVNDIRDIATDGPAGKNTLAVRFGKNFACQQYTVSLALGLTAPIILIIMGYSYWLLLSLLVAPMGLKYCVELFRAQSGPEYDALLIKTAKLLLVYSVLMSAGLILS